MKDILVVSCERSGTHFLIDSIVRNFPQYGQCPRADVPPTGDQRLFEKFFLEDFDYGMGRIVKSHHQWQFFEPIFDRIRDRFYFLYIAREGKDVMTSWHYYFNKAPRNEFPFTKTVGELMRKAPTASPFDVAYSKVRSNTMAERWARHINDWFHSLNSNRVLYLTYEELYINFDIIVNWIGRHIGNIFPKSPLQRPTPMTGTGVAPRKGIIGDWMGHFNKEDERLFYNEVSKVSPELYGRLFRKFRNNRLRIEYMPERGV